MNAADPTAGASLAFEKFCMGSFDTALAGFDQLGAFDPAYPLVAGERCDVIPYSQGVGMSEECFLQISGQFVYCPAGDGFFEHIYSIAIYPQSVAEF